MATWPPHSPSTTSVVSLCPVSRPCSMITFADRPPSPSTTFEKGHSMQTTCIRLCSCSSSAIYCPGVPATVSLDSFMIVLQTTRRCRRPRLPDERPADPVEMDNGAGKLSYMTVLQEQQGACSWKNNRCGTGVPCDSPTRRSPGDRDGIASPTFGVPVGGDVQRARPSDGVGPSRRAWRRRRGRPRSVHDHRTGRDRADGAIRDTTDEPSVAFGVGDGGPAFDDAGVGLCVPGQHATRRRRPFRGHSGYRVTSRPTDNNVPTTTT